MRLKNFLTEDIVKYYEGDILQALATARQEMRHFLNADIVWRGFHSKHSGNVIKITNSRSSFKGAMDDTVMKILDRLHIKAPVFCSLNKNKTVLFGNPLAFIPIGPFTAYSSPKVDDLLVAAKNIKDPIALNNLVTSYKTTASMASFQSKDEIIFDVKEYYLVGTYNLTQRNPFLRKVKPNLEIKKYSDLDLAINTYFQYLAWVAKRNKQNRSPSNGMADPV
jgi:hypothetical protein